MKRPRRSRQVRGARARNYYRVVARDDAGSVQTSDLPRVVNEATASGALASHQRLMAENAKTKSAG